MCTPECIIEMLGFPTFYDAVKAVIKAGKYRMYVDNLRTELRRLEDARVIIERRVREARDRGEEIENAVTHWQEDEGRMKNDVQELIGQVEARIDCFAFSCPDIMWRYRLGEQAEEKIRDVQRLVECSRHFEEISHPKPRPPELEFPSVENYVHLDSRTPIFEQIVVALKDPNVKTIGVHGLGGVGKTTLVEKVAKKLLDDKTFKQIPLVAISKVLNVKEIQKKLADKLNLRLDAPTDEEANQRQLWHKFRNGDNYLVILDDIWEVVNLIAIGIPITDGKIGCKVVLTSRNKDLLEIRMKTNGNFPIAELEEGEAWDLFKKQVGNSMESQPEMEPEMESLARKVCKKCKGLPVAIKALGAALERKPIHAWRTALVKLEKFMFTNIDGIDSSVLATLRASYDMLVSPDAKSCFLLCCLFPEDFEISIDELMRLCVVRSLLFQKPHTLEEARDATRSAVDILISTYLLSNGSNENVVRIHDVIRDVGISIAREEQAFLVQHGAPQWPRNLVNETSTISLNSAKIRELPDGLVYLQLHTLMFDNSELSYLQVPDNFFDGMKQLTVLILTRIRMRRPSSVAKLSNLQMLCLNQCKLANIAILGDLKTNLEVLSLRGSDIKALPPEMAQLTSLRVLDLRDCDDLKSIPQGIVSNLTNMEELYFANTFDYWEEIRLLLNTGQLTTLHIHIPAVTLLPKEDLMLEKLKRFKISVGSNFKYYENFPGTRILKYKESSLRKEFIHLVDKAEALSLIGIKGLKEALDYRGVGNGFPDLRYLEVKSCDDDLEYFLGEPKSSVQSHRLHPLQSFNKLNRLVIEKCKLRYLFTPTAARGLVHLEQLTVRSCEIMEAIVGFEGQNDENELIGDVMFSKLKKLLLTSLPNLTSFYAEKEKTQTTTGSSSAHPQPLFSNKVAIPVLEDLAIAWVPMIKEIWVQQPLSKPEKEVESFCKLKSIRVSNCDQLEYVLPSYMLPQLHNLLELNVQDCKELEVIVSNKLKEKEATNNDILVFPQLKTLNLWGLDNLKCFCTGTDQLLFSHKVILPVLEELKVEALNSIEEIWDKQSPSVNQETESFGQLRNIEVKGCKKLMNLVPSNILPRLRNLQFLKVEDCPNVEFVVFKNKKGEEEAVDDSNLIIPQLRDLQIWKMEKLKSFYSSSTTSNAQSLFNHQVILPVLEELEVEELDSIEEIWDKQSPSVNEKTASFSQLTNVTVKKCEKLMNLGPWNILSRLRNLQRLTVDDCPNVEFIVLFKNGKGEEEVADDSTLIIPLLKHLHIEKMEKLKSFYSSSTTANAQSLFNHQVILPSLEVLEVQALDSIKEIWDKQSTSVIKKTASFSQLRDMTVKKCKELVNLGPANILPRLQNLQRLTVDSCPNVEVIVLFKNGKEEEAADERTFIIPQLRYLAIQNMEKLKSFCSSSTSSNAQSLFNHQVILPVLETLQVEALDSIEEIWDKQSPSNIFPPLQNLQDLTVIGCPNVEFVVFKNGNEEEAVNDSTLIIPQLRRLRIWKMGKLKSFYSSSTTSNAQSLFNHQVAFPALEDLSIWVVPMIREIWVQQPLSKSETEVESFCKLKSITVAYCEQLEYVLPSYMLPQLHNLLQLRVHNCKALEVIVSNKLKEKEATNNDILVFPQLNTLELYKLHSLKCFCIGTNQLLFSHKDAFPVLEWIYIDEDLEFLRDKTSTKEECGTSGKENDHNVEEG